MNTAKQVVEEKEKRIAAATATSRQGNKEETYLEFEEEENQKLHQSRENYTCLKILVRKSHQLATLFFVFFLYIKKEKVWLLLLHRFASLVLKKSLLPPQVASAM